MICKYCGSTMNVKNRSADNLLICSNMDCRWEYDKDRPYSCEMVLKPVYWDDVGDDGVIISLEDQFGAVHETALTKNRALELVDLILKAIEVKDYEFHDGED